MKISNFKFQILGVFMFFLFAAFSFFVSKDIFTELDFNTTVKIQDKFQNSLVEPFSLFSLLGSLEVASMVLLIALLFTRKLKSIFVLFFYGLTMAFELFGKVLIEHKGPPILFLKTHLPFQFPSNYIPHEFYSYPSGHSARTAFVSAILIFIILNSKKIDPVINKVLIFLVLFFDFIMFFSRVYLGEHWSSDVLGGMILGLSLSLVASIFIINKKG